MPEIPTVYDTSAPKARKVHKCCECRGEILPGEKYHLFTGLWDGSWGAYKTCPECEALRNEVIAVTRDQEDYPAFSLLYEGLFENPKENPGWVKTFMETRRKRNAPESPRRWMEDAEADLPKTL